VKGTNMNSSSSFRLRASLVTKMVAAAAVVFAMGTIAPLGANAAPGVPSPSACTRLITGDLPGAQTVPTGQKWCLRGANVGGAITVKPAASLDIRDSFIDGAITLSGSRSFTMCNSETLGGAISASAGTGDVMIGNKRHCAGNRIDGAVTLHGNVGDVSIARNRLTGALSANSNAPVSERAMKIAGNRIGGDLTCKANTPAPRNAGLPNTVTGARGGQCAKTTF
jgi:hypothetical protein